MGFCNCCWSGSKDILSIIKCNIQKQKENASSTYCYTPLKVFNSVTPNCTTGKKHLKDSFNINDNDSLNEFDDNVSSCSLSFYHRIDNEYRNYNSISSQTNPTFVRSKRLAKYSTSDSSSDKEPEKISKEKPNDFKTNADFKDLRSDLLFKKISRKSIRKTDPSNNINKSLDPRIANKSTYLDFIDSLFPQTAEPSWSIGKLRDSDADRFIKKFKKNRTELIIRLLEIYNTEVFEEKLPKDLPVVWNARLLKTAGRCLHMHRKTKDSLGNITECRLAKIELAPKVCTSADRVRDTLLHELCHAAVWIVDNSKDGHGPLWRAWARKANSKFPHLPPVSVRHAYVIQTKYTYRCTGCGLIINRHSKSLDIEDKVCVRCHCSFQLQVNTPQGSNLRRSICGLEKRLHTIGRPSVGVTATSPCVVTKTPQSKVRARPAFADFVQEHYKSIRQMPGVRNHAEVMARLGAMFRHIKLGGDDQH